MGIKSQNGDHRTVLSEINVTPFVDVMLVLLVIFMVTTPILYQGIDVNLPETTSPPIQSLQKEKKIIITINQRGEFFIEEKQYDLSEIKLKVREFVSGNRTQLGQEQVFLKADRSIPYGKVVELMSKIQEAGVQNIGLITNPTSKN